MKGYEEERPSIAIDKFLILGLIKIIAVTLVTGWIYILKSLSGARERDRQTDRQTDRKRKMP